MRAKTKRWIMGFSLALAAILGLTTSYFTHRKPPETIPTSTVAHYPLTFVMQLKNDPTAGEKIYTEYCAACHAENPEIPVKAPRIHHPEDWERFNHLSQEALFKKALAGYKAMPTRGGCFECSDAQLKKAIDYLLSQKNH